MDEFLKDRNSPLKQEDLKYLRFYDADSSYRIQAKVEILPNATAFTIPAISGGGSEYTTYAILTFMLKGQPMKLEVYRNSALVRLPQYADYLFLPFTDETNGIETYDNGRYIDLRMTDLKDNQFLLDFNKAYNPYCAFSAGYACPKPPEANHLKTAIKAGEKKFAKGH